MRYIDINCDMGEGIGNDALVMPYIHSANIACGFHAGDESSMNDAIRLAMKYGVKIGAHVSYLDKPNFGRTEMYLSPVEVYELVYTQLTLLKNIANKNSAALVHVKPHGSLYNMSARDPQLAKTIANAVKDFEPTLVLFGLSGSHSISEASKTGLKTASEVFADRTYQEDGSLIPRSKPNALLTDVAQVISQVKEIAEAGVVTTSTGKKISVVAETVCIHGDSPHAIEFAKAIHHTLSSQ